MSANQPHPSREELFAYRDGELAPDRRMAIEAHVIGCHACRELIDEVSRLEAELAAGAPVPKEAYFERLTEKAMAKVAAADTTPALERRRSEAEAEWEESRRLKPRPPWFALASTVSAGAAVIVVLVLLVREGVVWRSAPSVAVLERSAPDAARSRGKADSVAAKGRGGGAAPGPARNDRGKAAVATPPSLDASKPYLAKDVNGAKADADKEKANQPAAPGSGTLAEKAANEETAANEAKRQEQIPTAPQQKMSAGEEQKSSSDEVGARAMAPEVSQKLAPAGLGNAAEPVGTALKSVLDRYGMPPVWGPGVSDDRILRAEPALRNLYRVGGAATAADSARVRLYLAEAARARAGAAPDSAAVDEIVHHYRRAIRLAGNDAEIKRVAAQRLQEFLDALRDEPSLHPPEGEGGQP